MNTGVVALLIGLGVVLALAAISVFVVFALRRSRASQQRLAHRVPGRPPFARPPRGLDDLRKRLARGSLVWVRPSELYTSPAEIDAMVRSAGFGITRQFGDRNDPVLLLSRTPIPRLSTGARPALRSMTRHVAIRIGLAAGLVIALLGMGAVPAFGLPAWFNLTSVGAGLLVAVAAGLLPLWPVFSGCDRRMAMLIAEFDGSPVRTVLAHQYLTDPPVVIDIAAELGYRYAGSRHGWLTASRWNETWITFVRTQTPQPRDGYGLPEQQ